MVICGMENPDKDSRDAMIDVRIEHANGNSTAMRVEIAVSDAQRRKGLSGRDSVPAGTGMLFQCPGPFWMKGCKVPLDIAFLDKDGVILSVQTMKVCDRPDQWQPNYKDDSGKCVAAVETASGWMSANNVRAGDTFKPGDKCD